MGNHGEASKMMVFARQNPSVKWMMTRGYCSPISGNPHMFEFDERKLRMYLRNHPLRFRWNVVVWKKAHPKRWDSEIGWGCFNSRLRRPCSSCWICTPTSWCLGLNTTPLGPHKASSTEALCFEHGKSGRMEIPTCWFLEILLRSWFGLDFAINTRDLLWDMFYGMLSVNDWGYHGINICMLRL